MFRLFKHKPKPASSPITLPIVQDMHSHILPGIDDGAENLTQSLQLIEGLMQLGIRSSIATPHIIGDMYRNSSETIQPALDGLRNELNRQQIDFEVNAAAEYMLDDYFLDLLKREKPLLTLQKNYILTEFSWMSMPENINDLCFRILTNGYQPILAHPERYAYFQHDYSHYHRLKDLGFHLQVNLLSPTGYYGQPVAKLAKYLIESDLVSFAGTDLHHAQHLEVLSAPKNLQLLHSLLGEKTLNRFD